MKDKIVSTTSHNGFLMVLTDSGRLFRTNVELGEWQEVDLSPIEDGQEELEG